MDLLLSAKDDEKMLLSLKQDSSEHATVINSKNILL